LRRGAAPLPAVAAARLRPRRAPGRRALPVRARDGRARHPRRGWQPRRRALLAAARRAPGGAVGPARRDGGRDAVRGTTRARDGGGGGMTTDGTDPRLERWATDDPHDARRALGATGLLRAFNDAGVLTAADVHVARRTADVVGEADESVRLAVALAVRAVRQGSVCVDLTAFGAAGEAGRPGAPAASGAPGPEAPDDPPLPWPDPDGWLERVAASPLAERSVVRADLGLLYLDRYWREECQVRDPLVARLAGPPPAVDDPLLERGAARLFPADACAGLGPAALAPARRRTTVLTGGPGRGKTTPVAGLLALLAEQHAEQLAGARGPAGGQPLRIALAAPTGKAAARLQDAVVRALEPPPSGPGAAGTVARPGFTDDDRHRLAGLRASTLHRLLGAVPGSST